LAIQQTRSEEETETGGPRWRVAYPSSLGRGRKHGSLSARRNAHQPLRL